MFTNDAKAQLKQRRIIKQTENMDCRLVPSVDDLLWNYTRGGTPPQYLYGYVPPNGVVILGVLI